MFALLIACQKASAPLDFVKYDTEAKVPRISIQDAKTAVDNGSAIIVDARPEGAFNAQHITGSINIPLGATPDKFATLPQGKKIIIYCS